MALNYHPPLNSLCHPHTEKIRLYNDILKVSYVDCFNESTVEFPHKHYQHYEIYYVEKGSLTLMADNRIYSVPEEHFMIISPGVRHGSVYTPREKKNYFVVIFNFYCEPDSHPLDFEMKYEDADIAGFFRFMKGKNCFLCKDCYHVYRSLDVLEEEITSKKFGWEFIVRTEYINIIAKLIRNFICPADLQANMEMTNLAVAITKYLHKNYDKPITIRDIADKFKITNRHVNRVFTDYFGMSVKKTLTCYRLSYSKNYLIETEDSISSIAEKVGLSSASTLSRLFSKNEGITITQYRRQLKNPC